MKKLYHFLGSVIFAVILIFLAAFMVAAGTFLEAKTGSHQQAADWIYKTIYFKILLVGFFVNILVSALRRWPFQIKHIPFLMTHLGLLMIITGTFIKTSWGLQGHLQLIEGSSAHLVDVADAMAVSISKRDGGKASFPLEKNFFGRFQLPRNSLCSLLEFCPNSQENIFSWISGDNAFFYGHQPFKAKEWQPGMPIPQSNPLALITNFKKDAIHDILVNHFDVIVSGLSKRAFPLKELLDGVSFEDYSLEANLKELEIVLHYANAIRKGTTTITLNGSSALLNQNSFIGKAPFSFDISSRLPLCLIQDLNHNTTVMTADSHGRVYIQEFEANHFASYIAYNDGFDGYAVQAEFLGPENDSRKQLEKKIREKNTKLLSEESTSNMILPLQIFQKACEECQVDFAKGFMQFLEEWNNKGGWLYPEKTALSKKLKPIFQAFDWSSLKPEDMRSSLWLSFFFNEFDAGLLKGENFLTLLKNRNWPLVPSLEHLKNDEERLTLFSQQLFAMGSDLPWIGFSQEPEMVARIFTAFLRIYGIHYSSIPIPDFPLNTRYMAVESPLVRESLECPAHTKLEDNIPRIVLQIPNGEKLALSYNRMQWPSKDGMYLFRFHNRTFQLPYNVRLHKARKINYPETDQAFSYECELTFKSIQKNIEERKVISMNEVYETWDGYRFYLSGLSKNSSGAHIVQLVVNRDPAKYPLTYPGGLLVAIGVVSLFWWKRI